MKRWPIKPLEEIAEVFGGSTPSRDNSAFWNGDIPWVTPTDLPMPDEGISIVSHTKDRITQAGLDNSSAKIVPKGTVLFSSRATIGKVAVAKMPLTTNQGFANFIPRSEVSSRFLAYSLWHRREDIARLSGSTTFKEVSRSTFRKYQIPVPPLVEQERIVKLLDEADELRKLRAQADRRTAALLPALFHEMFGDPTCNYQMWPVSPLGETLDVLHRYPTFYGTTYVEHGVPVARIGNILSSNTLDPDLSNYVRVPHDFSADFPRTLLKRGDLVMAVRGDTTGKVGIVPPSLEGANISPNLIRLSPNTNKILSEYLLWLLLITPSLIASNITDTAKKSITAENIGRIGIRVPPLQLQKEFAQRVTEIRSLEAAQATSRERLEALFHSMLHRAFNGEL